MSYLGQTHRLNCEDCLKPWYEIHTINILYQNALKVSTYKIFALYLNLALQYKSSFELCVLFAVATGWLVTR